MKIRFVRPEDVPALLAIYGQSIHTSVTFEYTLPSPEEFLQRVEEISGSYPYLVAQEGEQVVGYAYAHALRERVAYQWTAELSIYLDRAATGRGLGKKFFRLLEELLRLQGVRTVYSCVTAPNPASEALNRSMGAELVGVFHKSGYKNGGWHDVLWFEKEIAPHDGDPAPLLPFPQVDRQAAEALLAAYGGD